MNTAIRWTALGGAVLCLVLALWAAVGLASGQTSVPVDSLRALGNGRLLAVVQNRLVLVSLRGLTITDGVLEPVPAPQPLAVRKRLTYRPSGKLAEFVVPDPPARVEVYRNGLLMTEPDDYELAGSVVRFTPAQAPDAGDIVNILYEVAP